MDETVLEVDAVKKSYGATRVLHGISFSVKKGDIVGFLGRNGAGKTTALRLISGFTAPDAGTIRVFGMDHDDHHDRICSRLGYLPEKPPLYDDMKVSDYLVYCGRLKCLCKSEAAERFERVKTTFGLDAVSEKHCFKLSKGFRQRVGLAQAFLHEPDLVLLDEPTAGLDPSQADVTGRLIRSEAADRTIFLSSHRLEEVRRICNRIIIIEEGRIIADSPVSGISSLIRTTRTVEAVVTGDVARALRDRLHERFRNTEGFVSLEISDHPGGPGGLARVVTIVFEAGRGPAAEDISSSLFEDGLNIRSFTEREPGLEEVFLSFVSKHSQAAPDTTATA